MYVICINLLYVEQPNLLPGSCSLMEYYKADDEFSHSVYLNKSFFLNRLAVPSVLVNIKHMNLDFFHIKPVIFHSSKALYPQWDSSWSFRQCLSLLGLWRGDILPLDSLKRQMSKLMSGHDCAVFLLLWLLWQVAFTSLGCFQSGLEWILNFQTLYFVH